MSEEVSAAQTSLEEQLKTYHLCFDNASVAFALVSIATGEKNKPVDLSFAYLNAAFGGLLSFNPAEIVNKPLLPLFPKETAKWMKILSSVGKGKSRKSTEFFPDYGKYIDVEAYAVNPTLIGIVASDVTARQNALEQRNSYSSQLNEATSKLQKALDSAENAGAAKTAFLYRINREIRISLNTIVGLDTLALQEKGISETTKDNLDKIRLSAQYLLSFMNDVFDYAEIESGKMKAKQEPFVLDDLLSAINTIIYPQCQNAGVFYDCVYDSATAETYQGDAGKFQQVLINLLLSALKATPKGGLIRLGVFQFSRSKDSGHLRFTISDNGMGIDKTTLANIFEPFAGSDADSSGGASLTMPIVKNILGLMGGSIKVESIKNVGTNFIIEITLPILSEKAKGSTFSNQVQGLRVLVVDEDPKGAAATARTFTEAGFQCELAYSGDEAIRKIEDPTTVYDWAVLNEQMSLMSGLVAAKGIHAANPKVRLLLASYDWTPIQKQALANGVEHFLRKPITAKTLQRAYQDGYFGAKKEEVAAENAPLPLAGRVLLFADDNAINAQIGKHLLESQGAKVEIANDGAAALQSFTASPEGYYSAILMDIKMPKMDGLEATRAIRALEHPDAKSIPIIAMTANAYQDDIAQSLKAGMNAYLSKPIEPATLFQTLQRFMGPLREPKDLADENNQD